MGSFIREQETLKKTNGKGGSPAHRETRGTRKPGGTRGTQGARSTRGTRSTRATHSRTFAQLVPQFHIEEDDTECIIHVSMPGLKQDEVDVTVTDNHLIVSGRRTVQCEESGRFYSAYAGACSSFRRIFALPFQTDASAIQAVLKRGILTVTVPKSLPAGEYAADTKSSQRLERCSRH